MKAAMLSRAIAEHNRQHRECAVEEKILHTGQHYDYEMSEVFFREMNIPAPVWNLGCTGSPEEMKSRIKPILESERPDWVVVYGDTNSTAGGAMAANEAGIRLVHIEAGLRSFNLTMPEERNRVMTDKLSVLLFCPTQSSIENLQNEGITDGVLHTGDIMFDAAICFGGQSEDILDRLGIERPYVLATVHRAENTDSVENMTEILTAFRDMKRRIVWPMHPRTRKVIGGNPVLKRILEEASQVQVIDNQGYREMSALERYSELILTDSGGIQKEAYFHRVPCVTMRDETEWVETVEARWNTLTGANAKRIMAAVANVHKPNTIIDAYGDGHTAEKILECLLAY